MQTGMLEDYRAGLSIDKEHALHNRQNWRLAEYTTFCIWSKYDGLEEIYGDITGIWKSWAPHVRVKAIASGHPMAEEAPEEVISELLFFCSRKANILAAATSRQVRTIDNSVSLIKMNLATI